MGEKLAARYPETVLGLIGLWLLWWVLAHFPVSDPYEAWRLSGFIFIAGLFLLHAALGIWICRRGLMGCDVALLSGTVPFGLFMALLQDPPWDHLIAGVWLGIVGTAALRNCKWGR